jgi:hypothetical protein
MIRLLGSVTVLLACLSSAISFAQTVPPNAIPLITQVSPPSLPPGTAPSSESNFTLTILGANFTPNAIVNLAASPTYILRPSVTTVNPSGSRITAQFSNSVLGSPATYVVTVTNPAGTPPLTSNAFYLPATPVAPGVVLNQNTSTFLPGAPKGILVGDFKNSGILDVAVVSQNSNMVSILASNFTGPFIAGASYPTGNQPWGIAAGDFIGGGQPDLAITNSADNTITILIANGDGTFRVGNTVSLPGVFPTQLVAADFNGDGKMDLAVLNTCGTGVGGCFPQAVPQGPGTVTILFGNGDGTFTVSPEALTVGSVPYAIATADLNSDGFLDLVVANSSDNALTLLMGNGDGTFTPATSLPVTGNSPSGIVIGDFNGDGNLDIATTNSADNTVSILLNQNCSSAPAVACIFAAAPISPAVGANPSGIATGDLNADGFLDLVVTNATGNSVSVLLGDGTGAFHAVVPQGQPDFTTEASPQGVVLGDFNEDGRLDIVTSNASGSYSYLRQAAVAQLELTSSLLSPSYGQEPTFTAGIIPPFAQATPTGSMTFFDGTTAIGTVSLNSYQGILQFAGLSAGTHQITAVYSGDSNYVSVTSNAITETVAKAQTTTTLTSNVSNVPYGQPFTLTAVIGNQTPFSPTGTVTFFDTTSSTELGDVTPANGQAQLTLPNLTAGPHVVVATYKGDTNFLGSSSANITETVLQASTTTTVSAYPSPTTLGKTVVLTATVQTASSGTATGFVSFFDGGTFLATGQVNGNVAYFVTNGFFVGTHTFTAQYTGDTNFSGSTSSAIPETISPAIATISLLPSQSSEIYGQTFTVNATVQGAAYPNGPTGTLTFYDGAIALGSATLSNGFAQFTIPVLLAGSHAISAKYSGDANTQSLTSLPFTESVLQATTTTTLTTSQNPSSYGQAVTLTAALQLLYGGAATGTVTFSDGAIVLGTVTPTNSSAVLVISALAVGSHSILARYQGDTNTSGSNSAVVTQTVNPCGTTTTLTQSVNPSVYRQSVTIAATVPAAFGSLPAGVISYFDGTTLLGAFNTAAGPTQLTITSLTAGTHNITAQYSTTNSNFVGSTSAALTQTVNQSATTTSIRLLTNGAPYGQSVQVLVVVSASYPYSFSSGSVTLFDNGTSIQTAAMNGNGVTFTIPGLTAGTHPLTASFGGDPNLVASTSPVTTQTIVQEPTITLLTPSSFSLGYGQPVTLSVSVRPSAGTTATGTITFLDGTTAIGTVTLVSNAAQLTVSNVTPGTHAYSAQYSGDANTASSLSTTAQVTEAGPPTTTILTASPNPSVLNQSVALTATIQHTVGGTPTGTVTFYSGTSTLGSAIVISGGAQFTVFSGFPVSTQSLSATYSGDSNFSGSTSAALNEVVNPGPTSTTVSSSGNPSIANSPVTFTVTVNAFPISNGLATGLVTLFDGTTSLGSTSLPSGHNFVQFTLSTLAVGSHTITAQYGGSASLAGSTSSPITQTVNLPATTTTLSSQTNPAGYGQAVTLVATVQPSGSGAVTGSVTFFNGAIPLNTVAIANNTAQLSVSTLSVGSNTLTAKYSGDANNAASTSAPLTETINLAATTTTVSSNANPAAFAQSITLTANVVPSFGGSATGAITFLDGTTSLGAVTISSNAAQLAISNLTPGSHSITAKYSGDGNFAGSTSGTLTQTVTQATATTSVASNLNPATFGQSVIFTATVQPSAGGTPTGSVILMDGTVSLGSNSLSGGNSVQFTIGTLSSGAHSITAVYTGDANFSASTSATLTETVNPASTSTAIVSGTNPATAGQAVTFTATVQPSAGTAASGSVSFLDGTVSLGSVTLASNAAQLTISTLAPGVHSVTAVYGGSANLAGSTSAVLVEAVNQASTTTTVTSSLNPAPYGQAVTFVITIQPGTGGNVTGTLNLLDGTTTVGVTTLTTSQHNSASFTLSGIQGGTHTIMATYAGDSTYIGSTSAVLTQAITPGTTTTAITSSQNPAALGQTVVLSATIQTSLSGSGVGGMVTFFDGATTLGTAYPSNNAAQLSISSLGAGSHSLTAKAAGDANFSGSTSPALTQTVNQGSTTTTITSSVNPSAFEQTMTLNATVVPSLSGGAVGGSVTFFDGATALGTVNPANNVAQLSISSLAAGAHSITAKATGDVNFSGSTSPVLTQTVNQGSTTTTITSSLNPATFSQPVTFTVSVQPSAGGTPTGTVTLMDGTTSLGNSSLSGGGSAQFTVGGLSTGVHSVTAIYSGDANFTASTSVALVETVNPGSTTTILGSSANPSAFDQTVTFMATVQPPAGTTAAGTVAFMDGSTSLGSATLSSNLAQLAVSALTVGTHSVTAIYAGGANLSGSTSAVLSQVVNGASTTTAVSSSANPSTFGQGITLSATIQTAFGGNPTGTITFLDGTTSLGSATVTSNAAQLSLSSLLAGSHSITAKYSGDANFSGSTSTAFTQTVNQGSTATSTASSLNPSVFGQSVVFTATVHPPAGTTASGTVTFLDGATSLGTAAVANNSAQLAVSGLALGTHSLTASYGGNANLSGSASSLLTQTVSQAATATGISSSANPATFGQAVTFTATVQPAAGGVPTGTVTFFDGGGQIGAGSLSGGVAQFTAAGEALATGTHSITARYGGDSNFVTSTSGSLLETVNAAPTSTLLTTSANPSVTGYSVTFMATVSSSVAGTQSGTVRFYFDGSTTPAGSAALFAGTAQFSTSSLSVGNHTVVATFASSNSNFQGSSSATLTQEISDFGISASPASLTVSRSHSGTYTLTLSPLSGFTGAVSLSCSGVPNHTTCGISPSPVTLNGTSSAQATVTMTVGGGANTGKRTLTFKGTSGTVTRSTTVTLTIN